MEAEVKNIGVKMAKTQTAKQIWNNASKEKRRQLLSTLGYTDMDFAEFSWDQLSKRGGGMVKIDIRRLNRIRKQRK